MISQNVYFLFSYIFKLPLSRHVTGLQPKKQMAGKLLRKPRAPKPLPAIVYEPEKPFDYEETSDHQQTINHSIESPSPIPTPYSAGRLSPVPSLASHAPTEMIKDRQEVRNNEYLRTRSFTRSAPSKRNSRKSLVTPTTRERTMSGKSHSVNNYNVTRPYKPCGPEAFPYRKPKTEPEVSRLLFHDNDWNYYEPPKFMLNDFLHRLSRINKFPVAKVKRIIYSKNNYEKITKLISQSFSLGQTKISQQEMKLPGE